MAASLDGAKDEAEALARGSSSFLREVNWNGATERQREVVDKFLPVVIALWQMGESPPSDGETTPADVALRAFEQWFAEHRNAPFESLMEAEIVELPLVEV